MRATNNPQSGVIVAELDYKIQFVYEVAFAKRELRGLGVNAKAHLNDTIRFEVESSCDVDRLAARLAHFRKIGVMETEYSWVVSHNQKGSDNQFLTHWYYPYKGKYHPRFVRSIFNILGLEYGDTILDSFLGSGTTALEAHLFGLNCRGFDISPVCVIVSKVKVSAGEVADQLALREKEAVSAMAKDEERLKQKTKEYTKLIDEPEKSFYSEFLDSLGDDRIKDFYTLARLIYASDRGRRGRDFSAFAKNVHTMIESAIALAEVESELRKKRELGHVQIARLDSRDLRPVRNDSIDAIITSPPYSIALDYMKNDRDALAELGTDIKDLKGKCIGVRGTSSEKTREYDKDMQKCYDEMYRVLKKGRQCVIVIGDAIVDGVSTQSVNKTKEYCQEKGFVLKEDLPKKIFGLYNTMKDERVLFFEKS